MQKRIKFKAPLWLTALLANVIDHLETALYMFLGPVIVRDVFAGEPSTDLFKWSLGLTLGGLLRIVLALGWNKIHKQLGPSKILSLSLICAGSCCVAFGVMGILAGFLPESRKTIFLTLFLGLRALQSLFTMAETHAARSLIMEREKAKRSLASMLAGISSMGGIFLAGALCLAVSFIDPALKSWPFIYISSGILAILLGRKRRLENKALNKESSSKEKLRYFRLFLSCLGSSFGYATYHFISIYTSNFYSAPQSSSQSFLLSQTTIMGLDLALIVTLGVALQKIKTQMLTPLAAFICLLAALLLESSLISKDLARYIVLLAGVASTAVYSHYLVLLTHPDPLFPYSCLAGAVGSLVGGATLSLSLYLQTNSTTTSTLPFAFIFFLQALFSLLFSLKDLIKSPRP